MLAQNGIPSTVGQHIKTMNDLGGLDVLGTPKADNMYHAGWAWAGSTPYQATKLVASHFGGTRQPMAVSWPKTIKHDTMPRIQFHHVNDIAPTIYDLLKITPPREVNGVPQDPIDGISLVYTFGDANAKGRKLTQYFEIMGSRVIYHDGWIASAFGPRIPWLPGLPPGIHEWTPDKDKWELYNLEEDWSQANDLAGKMSEKVAQMKEIFAIEAARNNVLPIGDGLYVMPLHPELRLTTPYKEWNFTGDITRMPEFAAPSLGNKPNLVTIDTDISANANGVLYSIGAFSGGLTTYVKKGILCYEYNLFEIMRTRICSKAKLPAGKAKIEVMTACVVPKPGGPLKIVMKVNGKEIEAITKMNGKQIDKTAQVQGLEVGPGIVPVSAPLAFTANDCLDIGTDLGSPVSLDYFEQAPFAFNGKIQTVHVKYVQ